mmetsp:Transcript_95916/g.273474  ORF Transcript_95916/g.273474 Transcript_95916/m.273474 type:complete len:214 (-) Transcript_95916:239-880(-)
MMGASSSAYRRRIINSSIRSLTSCLPSGELDHHLHSHWSVSNTTADIRLTRSSQTRGTGIIILPYIASDIFLFDFEGGFGSNDLRDLTMWGWISFPIIQPLESLPPKFRFSRTIGSRIIGLTRLLAPSPSSEGKKRLSRPISAVQIARVSGLDHTVLVCRKSFSSDHIRESCISESPRAPTTALKPVVDFFRSRTTNPPNRPPSATYQRRQTQ